jgi:trimeric autotransporter adhesin
MNKKSLLAIGALTAALSLFASANAQMTTAGTNITNKASATYLDSVGQPKNTESNEVVTVVRQVYGISLTPNTTSGSNGTATPFLPYEVTNHAGAPSVQNDKSATPNSQVRFDYVLTNNGNGTDTVTLAVDQDTTDTFNLTAPTFYRDAALTIPIVGNVVTLAPGEQINVYVAAGVPAGQTAGQTADIDVTATGLVPNGANGTPNNSDDNRDNNNIARVTVVNDAILTVTKTGTLQSCGPSLCILYTISGSNSGTQPARAVTLAIPPATASQNTHGIVVSDVIPVGTELDTSFTPTASGGTSQTIMYSNSLASTDALAADWTAAANVSNVRVGAVLKSVASGTNTTANADVIAVSGNYTLQFRVRILTTTAPGTDILNTARTTYNNSTNTRQDVLGTTTTTTPTLRDVAIGPVNVPFNDPTAGPTTPAGFTDPVTGLSFIYTQGGQGKATLNPAPLGATPVVDFTTVASAPTGTTVSYKLTIENRGNASDQFTLSLVTPNGLVANVNESFLPAGSTVDFYDASGNTTLSGSTTTNVAANTTTDVVVKVFIPANAPTAGTAPELRARIKVESAADPSKTDFTLVRVSDVVAGQGVDLRNEMNNMAGEDANGDTPSGTTVTKSTTPSPTTTVTVNYPITVRNSGASTDTFNLTTASLPPGVTGVQFFLDANADGIPDSGTPLVGNNTGSIPAAGVGNFVAVLTVATNAAPVPQDGNGGDTNDAANDDDFTITATSASNGAISDSIVDSLVILPRNDLNLTPSRSGDVTSPGSIVYSHTLTNDGNSALTDADFALSGLPLGAGTLGFSYTIYRDVDNSGTVNGGDVVVYTYDGATNTVTTPGNNILPGAGLPVGSSLQYLVQVNTIAGLPEGTIDTRTLSVTGTFGTNGTGSDSVVDTTRVIKGELRLRKFANPCDNTLTQGGTCPSTAPDPVTATGTVVPRNTPGMVSPFTASRITYTIVGENIGATYIGGAVGGAIITDPIPANADYVLGTASASCAAAPGNTCTLEYSTDNGVNWTATQPTDSANTGTSQGISDAADGANRVTNIRVRITGPSQMVGMTTITNAIQNGAKITLTFEVSVR